MDTVYGDLRLALRALRRAPGFTLGTILLLALGIGAATAVFSVVNAAWLRPLPHLDADRWATLYERPLRAGPADRLSVSIPNFRDWRQASRSLDAMALWMPWSYNLSGDAADPERVSAAVITPQVFAALGLTPAAGRLLQASDDPAGPARPVMISYGLWQRRFGGDPAIAGRPITLNLVPHTVVGVAPRDFAFPPFSGADVWAPFSDRAIDADTHRDARGMQVAAMRRADHSWAAVQAELQVIAAGLASRHRENDGFDVEVVPVRDALWGPFQTPLLTLLGALAVLLLLVCLNVANLQLVTMEGRRRELAVRAALGASRTDLVRQPMLEALGRSIVAGGLGLALAPLIVRRLLASVPSQDRPWPSVPADLTVLIVCAGVTCATAMIAGVLPAWRAARTDASAVLAVRAGAGDGPDRGRLRRALVVAQLTASCVLLVLAALLIQSVVRLRTVDPGFSADNRLTLSYTAPRARYGEPERLAALAGRLREEVAGVPGVVAAGAAQALPFAEGTSWFQALTRTDPRSVAQLAALPHVHYNVVTPGFVETLGIALERGRTFDERDRAGSAPVVIVNAALVRRFFPGEDPIGRQLWVGHAQDLPASPPRTVVGVIGDTRWSGLDAPADPEAWVPLAQQVAGDGVFRTMFLVVHTAGDPMTFVPQVRARIRHVDSALALTSIRSLDSRLDEAVWRHRLTAAALGGLSVAALAIAVLGVFTATSQIVGRRTREMGVRLALGAEPRRIVALVMQDSGRLVLLGVGLGLAGAAGAARLVSTLLYGVGAADLTTAIAIASGLASAGLLASYLPARRAARLQPLVALRDD